MRSKKYRVQRDSLQAINLSMTLFVKLLMKTCEVVQSTSTSSGGPKRAANTIDVDHLAKAVKRYEVLSFMQDMVSEMQERSHVPSSLGDADSIVAESEAFAGKRKQVPDETEEGDVVKKQRSIASFFAAN